MKLHSSATAGMMAITSYDAEHIGVNGRRLTRSFIVTPRQIIEDWAPTSFEDLAEADIERIAVMGSPIVLLGTGMRQRFPKPALLRPLIERRVGVEIMDSHAACRTYNILMSEGRDVVAALILECKP